MVAAYCMGVRGRLVAGCFCYRGCRHDRFHVVPETTVPVEIEKGKEAPRDVEYPPFKCEPSRRRDITKQNIS